MSPTEGGTQPWDIELSKLIARTALVVRIGGLSDAIYYNALAPELTISPLGDILFRDEFGRVVVEPMITREMGTGSLPMPLCRAETRRSLDISPRVKGR